MSGQKRLLLGLGIPVALLLAIVAWQAWYHLARKGPPAVFEHPELQFKYGGIGLKQGFPYYLWALMPGVFADLLPRPGGWEVFGFIDEGRGYPVGFARQTVGYPGLTPNCALCHTGRYRKAVGAAVTVVPGAPAGTLDFKGFDEFVFAAANDPRFDPDVLLPAMEKRFQLGWSERLIYRYLLLPALKKTLIEQGKAAAWMNSRPDPGRGRFDAFNLFKIIVLGLPDDGSTGTSDYPPLWHQGARAGQYLHWNGSNNNLQDENLMSVYPLNNGPAGFLPQSFTRMTDYLRDLPPPAYPYPIDQAQAEKGKQIYDQYCAACHAFDGAKVGQVTPQEEVGTDPAFLKMWSKAFVARLKTIDSPPFHFPGLRRTDGYLNVPLDGCWLRAPYLHNGSVPTLRDLLRPAAERPLHFYRGSDVYDPVNMGFQSTVPGAGESLYDTTLPGNSNTGHEYGTTLSGEQKSDLLEFLKTL